MKCRALLKIIFTDRFLRFLYNKVIFLSLLLLTSCEAVTQYYRSYQRANYNPYLAFFKSLDCHCLQESIVTPQLQIFKKSQSLIVSSDFDVFSILSIESHPEKKLYLKYNKNICGNLDFKLNDIVIVKGRIDFEKSYFLIEPKNGFIEINGKKYCLE